MTVFDRTASDDSPRQRSKNRRISRSRDDGLPYLMGAARFACDVRSLIAAGSRRLLAWICVFAQTAYIRTGKVLTTAAR